MGKYANLFVLLLFFHSEIPCSSLVYTSGELVSEARWSRSASEVLALKRSLGSDEQSNSSIDNAGKNTSSGSSADGRLSETVTNSSGSTNNSSLVNPTGLSNSTVTESSLNPGSVGANNTNSSGLGVPPVDKVSSDGGNMTDIHKDPEISQPPQFGQTNDTAWKVRNQTNDHSLTDNISESCDRADNMCTDQEKLVACVKNVGTGSENTVILIQNKADRLIKVNLTVTHGQSSLEEVDVPSHQAKVVNISNEGTMIILNAGGRDCMLRIGAPVNDGNFFVPLPSEFSISIHGTYLLLATVLILSGTWACCIFRNRQRHSGNQYQELEMGRPDSASMPAAEAADWDDAWDDGWESDKAT